jgi:hypothetical protein
MGSEQRAQRRVSGYAKALLVGPLTPGYVRDLSRSGCQVAFMQPVKAAAGDALPLRIIAEHDPSLAPFEITLRVRWVKPDAIWQSLGGQIEWPEGSSAAGAFEKLVEYYEGAGS